MSTQKKFPLGLAVNAEGVVYLFDQIIGMIIPTAEFSIVKKKLLVAGKFGMFFIDGHDPEKAAGDLVAAGALLMGGAEITEKALTLINAPRTSRTSVYFMCLAEDLHEFVEILRKITDSRVAIVGCGGIGSSIAYLLAGAGVNKLTLIDPDFIEESNLNRQLFWTMSDIGKSKVSVLKEALHQRFGTSIEVETIDDNLNATEIAKILDNDFNGAVITADNPLGLYMYIVNAMRNKQLSVVGGGYYFHELITYEGFKIAKIFASKIKGEWYKLIGNPISPSYGPVNAELAGLLANRILQKISGLKDGSEDQASRSESNIFPRTYNRTF